MDDIVFDPILGEWRTAFELERIKEITHYHSGGATGGGGGGGTTNPAGSDTQVQFNDGGAFGADAHFYYNKTTDVLHVHGLAGDATDGLLLESENGTDIGILGAANTANVTWYGNHNFNNQTANTIAGFGASKTLQSLDTSTYPTLTELSYVKGVTSSIQTQLNAINLWEEQTGAYTALTQKTNGNLLFDVGTGATSPYTVGGGITPDLNIVNSAGASAALTVAGISTHGYSGTGFDLGSLLFFNRSRGTSASPTALQANDIIGGLVFGGYGQGDYQLTVTGMVATSTDDWDVTPNSFELGWYIGSNKIFSTDNTLQTTVNYPFKFGAGSYLGINADYSVNNRVKINEPTTGVSTAELLVSASSAARTPLVLQGYGSQSASLMDVQNSAGTSLFALSSSGAAVWEADTNLYRSAADTLKTDDAFEVGSTITMPNNTNFRWKDSGGTIKNVINLNASNNLTLNTGATTGNDILFMPRGVEAARFDQSASSLLFADAVNLEFNTTTGTKIGTDTTQKIGFWNATPIVQPVNTTAIDTLLTNTGLRASGGTANFDTDVSVPDEAYGVGWNGSLEVPTKNAVYDKINSMFTNTANIHVGTSAPGSPATGDIWIDTN